MKYRNSSYNALLGVLFVVLFAACSTMRYVPEDEYLLTKVSMRSDSSSVQTSLLQGYLRQQPNNKWFSLVNVPLYLYSASGPDSTKFFNKLLRRLGEAPVIYDEEQSERTRQNIESAVQNLGYLNAEVNTAELRKNRTVKVRYTIHPYSRYQIRKFNIEMQDSAVGHTLDSLGYEVRLTGGMPFDLNILDAERNRLHTYMANNGYYRFNNECIHFEADTTVGNQQVDLKMIVKQLHSSVDNSSRPHQQYHIGNIDYVFDQTDSNKPFIRKSVVTNATKITEGGLYRESDVQETYSRLIRLGAVMTSNVRLQEGVADSTTLDTRITLMPNKANSFSAELEGTNSAGDLGAAVALSYLNRNIFRGSEQFSVKLRGAFEAIKGLKGYKDQNYMEYSAEVGLSFPDFKFPFISRELQRKAQMLSEISFAYDLQDRPEFHRRVATATWRYRWTKKNRQLQHRLDMLDLNYVFMPWISDTFREYYLDDPANRNAILRYNYENLFIMKWGYTFNYSSRPLSGLTSNYGTNAYTIRAAIETSGNLLYGLSSLFKGKQQDDLVQYKLFNIAYAQYVKGDFDWSKSFLINETNSLALHFGLGVAYPYGNSTILPYEKRYFSGGANSVRGWSVRELGPGSFQGTDGRIDFINQTGDIKLDMNAEYRTHLFWKLDGAAFIDAGNIWTIRSYEEQPGGQFQFDTFWRQIAVSYGLGVRLNFNYFILRVDGGMKAVHPAYTDSYHHFPIIHPNLKRDFTFHFAVGLPF